MRKIILFLVLLICVFQINIYSQCVYNISPTSYDTIYTPSPTLYWYSGCNSCTSTNCQCFGGYSAPDITLRIATDSLMSNVVYTKYNLFGTNYHTIPANILQNNVDYWWRLSVKIPWFCYINWPNCVGGPSGGFCEYFSIPFKFITNFNPVVLVTISSEIPNQFSLSQNFPNPFNPGTKIQFALSMSSFATIVIYDALGKEVETILNEQLNAGTYETEWNAVNYPSGVYYYKLFAGDYAETRKMVLMK